MTDMNINVTMRRNRDGEVRVYRETYRHPYQDNWKRMWSDGNWACDCNRYLFFQRAADEEEERDEDHPDNACGHERYSVLLITDADTGSLLQEGENRS